MFTNWSWGGATRPGACSTLEHWNKTVLDLRSGGRCLVAASPSESEADEIHFARVAP